MALTDKESGFYILDGTIYSDEHCHAIAQRYDAFLKDNSKEKNYAGIRYDSVKKLFILTSYTEGEVEMYRSEFFELLQIKEDELISAEKGGTTKISNYSRVLQVSKGCSTRIRRSLRVV